MKTKIHTLDNGLRIALTHIKNSTTTTFMIMTGTGSRYENIEENGMAHFLEHMFFKGTKERPNAKAISEELDAIGGVYNAFTGKDKTAYYAKVSCKHTNTAIDVISDIFLNSKLPQKEIDKERGAILQEINMYADMPMHSVDDVFDAAFFAKGSPLSRTILGPKKNIKSFSRQEFKTYLKRNYNSKNTVISIAGNFNEKKILNIIKKKFSNINITSEPICEPAILRSIGAPKVSIKYKKTEQTHIMLGVPAYKHGHKDTYTQMLLISLLSGGMSSRLFTEVREKRGLAYSVRAWTERYTDTAYLAIQAGIEPENLTKATKVIISILNKLKRIKVTDAELNKAKEYILGHKAIQNEKTDTIATQVATQLIHTNKVTSEETLKRNLQKITANDIKRIAKDLFKTDMLTLAIIGPHKNTAELEPILAQL